MTAQKIAPLKNAPAESEIASIIKCFWKDIPIEKQITKIMFMRIVIKHVIKDLNEYSLILTNYSSPVL